MATADPPLTLPPAAEAGDRRVSGPARSGMTRGRLVVFAGLLAVFGVGHLIDLVTFKEHWPYSPYRMYSGLQGKTFTAYYVYGITRLDPYEETSLSSYGVPRKLFGNLYLRGEEAQAKAAAGKVSQEQADKALADAKADVAARLQEYIDGEEAAPAARKPARKRHEAAAAPAEAPTVAAGEAPARAKAGRPQFLGARLYKTTWELRPDASNRNRPERVVLVQVMAKSVGKAKAPSTQTVPAIAESLSGEGEDKPGVDPGPANAPVENEKETE